MSPLNLEDFERLMRRKLDPVTCDYYLGGAADEITLRDNAAAWQRLRLLPRALRDVGTRYLRALLQGQPIDLPVIVGPTAFQALAHPEGELATARAAEAAGTVMVLSTLANHSMAQVRRAAPGLRLWFQLYVYRDREVTRALIDQARDAGVEALVLTVDNQIVGLRERDRRNGFRLPAGLAVKNLVPEDAEPPSGESGLAHYVAQLFDPSLSWKDLEWLVGIAGVPVWVKGILRSDDAGRALDCGAAGVFVSNHGARQLDTVAPTAEALPAIAQALAGRGGLLVDGGIRRGTDVVKALALGAQAVGLGRPVLAGLAVNGAAGVTDVLAHLGQELDIAMGLCGCGSLADIDAGLLCATRPRTGLSA